MKQQTIAKNVVAWFKIAEFVSRGEKERALAVYRLLAHTIDDQAFVQQLEADILLAFHDEAAFEHYAKAAMLYVDTSKYAEAAAIYEHLIMLEPTTQEQLRVLVELLNIMPTVEQGQKAKTRMTETTLHYLRSRMEKNEFEKVSWMLQELDGIAGSHHALSIMHQELVTAWLKISNPPTDPLRVHVRKTIDYYFGVKQQKSLPTFLMTLKMLHSMLYQDACFYMQEVDLSSR